MSDNNHAVADFVNETYPDFSHKIQDGYIEGYDPVSFSAPHSSLLRTSTWVGMGLILSLLPAIGTIIWGVGTKMYPMGTTGAQHAELITIVGCVALAIIAVAAIVSVKVGRKAYREYRAATGRVN